MARRFRARAVLAVRDPKVRRPFFREVLGFSEEPVRVPGCSSLSLDGVQTRLGEGADEMPAGDTTWLDVTPHSQAQCGLHAQVHQDERDVSDTMICLRAASGGPVAPLDNILNRDLNPRGT